MEFLTLVKALLFAQRTAVHHCVQCTPPPRKFNHLAIWLKPICNKKLKTNPVTVRTTNTWTDSAKATELLRDCRLEHLQRNS